MYGKTWACMIYSKTGIPKQNNNKIARVKHYSEEEMIYIFPIYCDGSVLFSAFLDDDGNVTVSENIELFEGLDGIRDSETYMIFASQGRTFATSSRCTITLEDTEQVDEESSFEKLSFYKKMEKITQRFSCQEKEYYTALNYVIKPYDVISINAKEDGYYDEYNGPVLIRRCALKSFVNQGSGTGLCWAAAIATILNYKLDPHDDEYTAPVVWAIAQNHGMNISINSGAFASDMAIIFDYCGRPYYKDVKLTFKQVQKLITRDRPFVIILQRKSNANQHSIVGYGISYNLEKNVEDSYTIYAWDPCGNKISFKYNNQTIHTNNHTYSWKLSMD